MRQKGIIHNESTLLPSIECHHLSYLCRFFVRQTQHPAPDYNMLTLNAQGFGPLFRVVQERTIEVSVLSHDPYPERLDLAHIGYSSGQQSPTQGFI